MHWYQNNINTFRSASVYCKYETNISIFALYLVIPLYLHYIVSKTIKTETDIYHMLNYLQMYKPVFVYLFGIARFSREMPKAKWYHAKLARLSMVPKVDYRARTRKDFGCTPASSTNQCWTALQESGNYKKWRWLKRKCTSHCSTTRF